MIHGTRVALYGFVLVAATGWEARAQYYTPYGNGYAGYGFGGFSGTPQGGIARGLGVFAEGQGVYNVDTAQAESIDADTIMRFNQFTYASHLEAQRRYNASQSRRLNLDKAGYDARQARIRDNPTNVDIDSGDALNAILDQLTEPKVMAGPGFKQATGSLNSGFDSRHPISRRDRRHHPLARPVDRPQSVAPPASLRRLHPRAGSVSKGSRRRLGRGQGRRNPQARNRGQGS